MKETFTIEEIEKYILSKDSLGDVLYYLSAENIIKANEPDENDGCCEDGCCGCNCGCGE